MSEYFQMGYDAFTPYKSSAMCCPWSRWPHTYERVDEWMRGWDNAKLEYKKSLLSQSQKHVGKLKGKGDSVWHSNMGSDTYWCGSTHKRTAKELYTECLSIMGDLLLLHPELKDEQPM